DPAPAAARSPEGSCGSGSARTASPLELAGRGVGAGVAEAGARLGAGAGLPGRRERLAGRRAARGGEMGWRAAPLARGEASSRAGVPQLSPTRSSSGRQAGVARATALEAIS